MKRFLSSLFVFCLLFCVYAQDDDDLFFDEGIEEVEDVSAKTDLSKGILFENGTVKIGGNISSSITSNTLLYSDDGKSFGEHIKDSVLTPSLSSYITVDARPIQNLRMYTKFGVAYPYPENTVGAGWFSLKELFTDFSTNDRAFFRFGLHTVTWGTGYFYSPCSDIVNSSIIDPENVSAGVDGCLNLRTQITFPDSQNCLWLYIIPSKLEDITKPTYLKDTAFAMKSDLVFGGWELGLGTYWKYRDSPKFIFTASGTVFKSLNLFGEFVYAYGDVSEWTHDDFWEDKTSIFKVTAGGSYTWKDPSITLAMQYYYNSNDINLTDKYITKGHNVAATLNFGKLFNSDDFTLNFLGILNIGREELTPAILSYLSAMNISTSLFNSLTCSAMFGYKPFSCFSMSAGPYFTWADFDSKPDVSLKLSFTLGGGKF